VPMAPIRAFGLLLAVCGHSDFFPSGLARWPRALRRLARKNRSIAAAPPAISAHSRPRPRKDPSSLPTGEMRRRPWCPHGR